jgi:dCTP deaminase
MPTNSNPWDDWTPGVLSKPQVQELVKRGFLSVEPGTTIGTSSMDLTLSAEAYCLPDGAIKPSGPLYLRDIREFGKRLEPIPEGGLTLEAQQTYLVRLRERLFGLKGSGIYGQATAKSSVGRVDVLARLIVNGMDCYESFHPERLEGGDLYLEITPLTFPVRIKPGISLSQLRLFYGSPEGCQLSGIEAYKTFIKGGNDHDGKLTVDLSPAKICGHEVVAFRAREAGLGGQCEPVPLWKGSNLPEPWKYWEFVKPSESKRLSLRKDYFYILRSKELLALPKGVAVYCRAIDESFGEMRIHYAGFAHPWFGRKRSDGQIGTPLIFEVRGHDVNVTLQHGESMARLLFYRMSEDASEEDADPSYEGQILKLSQYFGAWPERVDVDENGTVGPAVQAGGG